MISKSTALNKPLKNPSYTNGFIKLMSAHSYREELPSIIHINGENASGKSTLLREFIRYHLPISTQPIYIADNEGGLSPSILQNMFSSKNSLLERMYHFSCQSVQDLFQLIESLPMNKNVKKERPILIINSFSRILKSTIGSVSNYADYIHAVHTFSDILFPKISTLTTKGNFLIILIHHITFNPIYNSEVPYYADFIQMLQGSWISLKSTQYSPEKWIREITFSNIIKRTSKGKSQLQRVSKSRRYILDQGRFLIMTPNFKPDKYQAE
ncbi:hypothetical protein NEF87_004780 [Candidatus Lokiarchaeum ossiferum]|uniref:AAA+ ATPase domain-containing protein n=1 Tax=Candidatus Lokiarchaeum ossiferum TaxID=2951803 RepID=A0ABY6HYA7_9ARCH|nr:hypothetical protein NEF87_004780 [Candidatus Lokiarchaeum sp. B-35]